MPTKIIDKNHFAIKGFTKRLANSLLNEATIADPLKLEFSGYETDPRELIEIPEFVRFIKKLNKSFQGWLTPRIHRDTIWLVLTTLTSKGVYRAPNSFAVSYPVDPGKWQKQVQSMCCKSEFGLDCGAQLAFACFPEMMPDTANAKHHTSAEQAFVKRVEASHVAEQLAEENKTLLVEYILNDIARINVYSKTKTQSGCETYDIALGEGDIDVHDISKISKAILNKE
ncbi:hypothetical protein [Vibrio harveyi]|uniref:hypothetical protein n=1 Tax=Vibrio harveyi TaxID=669 RepID=UPI003CF1CDA2